MASPCFFLAFAGLFVISVTAQQELPDYEDMGNSDVIVPPDFASNPFPNQPGFDPFSRQNQFNDPFVKSSTEDPFRRVIVTSTTEAANQFNQFQNNEQGGQRPINPFPQNPRKDFSRPQVDEFGNPLGNPKIICYIQRLLL